MEVFDRRKYIVILIFALVGVIFLIKLFDLQILDQSYKKSAANNVLREVVEYPARGLIYDRNGELLVYNEAIYDLLAIPREVTPFDTLQLCETLGINKEDFVASMKKAKEYSRTRPSVVAKQILPERYAQIQEKMYKYPGFFFQTRTQRNYNHNIAAHLFGYVMEVGPSLISPGSYYKQGDYIGGSGIERAFEDVLRGKKGFSYVMVDVYGREKGSYQNGKSNVTSEKGKDIVSSIDYSLQEYAEMLMQGKAGSVMAIEPSSGEVLAMVSSPFYSPDIMIGQSRSTNFAKLQSDSLRPLYNRAIQAQYPPGSTFKMAQALVALQEGIISPSTMFMCAHGYHSGNFTQACHHDQKFNLSQAIAQSCNAYFDYAFRNFLESKKFGGIKKGYEHWRDDIITLGFGSKIMPELEEENSGFIPTAEYYQRRVFKNSRWRALPIISIAIGQGELLTTPAQMANYAALLANRGYYYPPHAVKMIQDGNIDESFKQKVHSNISTQYFDDVIQGMEMVMTEGTGKMSYIPGISVCGKTGTAQNPHGADHSTFIAFAPKENPKIAIAVYVENGQWGSTYAAPIASLIIEKYINGEIQPTRKWLETSMQNVNLLYPGNPNYIKY